MDLDFFVAGDGKCLYFSVTVSESDCITFGRIHQDSAFIKTELAVGAFGPCPAGWALAEVKWGY